MTRHGQARRARDQGRRAHRRRHRADGRQEAAGRRSSRRTASISTSTTSGSPTRACSRARSTRRSSAHGPRSQPTVNGYVKLDRRAAGARRPIRASSRIYGRRRIDQAGAITLKQAYAQSRRRQRQGHRHRQAGRHAPRRASTFAPRRASSPFRPGRSAPGSTRRSPIHGKDDADGMSGTITIEKGTANLPKLAGGKKLQSTGPLQGREVRRPARARAPRRARSRRKRRRRRRDLSRASQGRSTCARRSWRPT